MDSGTDLCAYSAEHLAYEVGMFVSSRAVYGHYKRVGFPTTPAGPFTVRHRLWVTEMALLEAMLQHGRILINFFYPGTVKKDDIVAAHFFHDPLEWDNIRPPLTPGLQNLRNRVNKEAAHLTTKRIAGIPPEKSYDDDDFAAILTIVELFIDNAPSERLHENVRRALQGV